VLTKLLLSSQDFKLPWNSETKKNQSYVLSTFPSYLNIAQLTKCSPRQVGIDKYVESLRRADQVVREMGNSSLGANPATVKETAALVKYGIRQLEEIFKHTLLSTGASGQLEPLTYISKGSWMSKKMDQDKEANMH
jgi:hypothetical protein